MMKISRVGAIIDQAIIGLFVATPSENSKLKLKKLTRKLWVKKWPKDLIEDYIEFTYNNLLKVKDRYKRSNVNYFIGILTNQQNIDHFMDFSKEEYLKSPSPHDDDDSAISYKGRDFTYLQDIEFGEVYFYEDIEKERYVFVVRDLLGSTPRLMFLSRFNKEFPDRAISRKTMIGKARLKSN